MDQSNVEDTLQRVRELQDAGRFFRAEKKYNDSLAALMEAEEIIIRMGLVQSLNFLMLQIEYARTLRALKEYEKALNVLKQVRTNLPDKAIYPAAETYHQMAEVYKDMGEYSLAEQFYLTAFRLGKPDDPNEQERNVSRVRLANIYLQGEKYDEAVHLVEEVFLSYPNEEKRDTVFAVAMTVKGKLFCKKKQFDKAITCFLHAGEIWRKYSEIKFDYVILQHAIAECYFNINDIRQAVCYEKQALELVKEKFPEETHFINRCVFFLNLWEKTQSALDDSESE